MDAINFREAKPSDAEAIGALHVTSWLETYAGLVSDQLLDDLSAEERSAMWRAVLDDPARFGETAVFVAESGEQIVGFGACGGQRDEVLEEQGFSGEVGAIYVLRSHQHAGVGKSLMSLMARKLSGQGRSAATLWVLRENVSARTFYEGLGGVLVGEREDEHSGTKLTEVAYGWSNLSPLVR